MPHKPAGGSGSLCRQLKPVRKLGYQGGEGSELGSKERDALL